MIWLISIIILVAASTTLSFGLCLIIGQLTPTISAVSLAVGIILGILSFVKLKSKVPPLRKFNYFDWAMILFFMVFCFRHFLWLIFSNNNSVMALDPSNWGELPKHLSYLGYLARGAHFWPQHPFLVDAPFTYHFGIDLFSAMLLQVGIPFINFLPLMGFIAGSILAVALLSWGGGFALGAFLFAGGGIGYKIFATGEIKDYQVGKPWTSIVTLFMVQRGFLYALPAGILLLWSWRRRFFSDEFEKPLPIFIEGLIWGTMPLFQIQTFLFLSFVYACWFLTTKRFKSITVFAWALVPACIEVFLVTDHFKRGSLVYWNPGWMIKGENPFFFFWNNYGLFLPLAIAAFIFSFKKPQSWRQMTPAVIIFVLCFFITFQPWDWDNIKLMMWSYILILPFMYDLVLKTFSLPARTLNIVLLFIPGFIYILSMHNPQNHGNEMYTRQTLDGVCTALKNVSPEARVATAKIHNHPVLLCGQPVVVGYTGVLWGEGLIYGEKEAKLTQMMLGSPNWRQLAIELKAKYLFWGPNETTEYAGSTRPWEHEQVKILAQGAWGTIYEL